MPVKETYDLSMNMKTILLLLIVFYTLITFSDAEKAKIDSKSDWQDNAID